jgi:hypothetical protein
MILWETAFGALLALLTVGGIAAALSRFSASVECRNEAFEAALRVRALATRDLPKNAGRTPQHTWIEWPCPGNASVRITLPHLEPEKESTSL